ncbi:GTP cyclohydrolase 1 [Amborella trichopoda]|uniref:GTP cyclohydrolase 1 n=1 Tax=Amborella trichopoda TaxID=13333 RepID=W1PS39_AMBTC|nr:GTP cyclohydrolase 1 [Amborella trichopoda]ERN10070.1 hypothetical protein AMTR_s00013p00256210 [Amborella trichopoda]|eukprot:XP_006848489.1 GTP cyclohydrolase 1 [Amborella trichopoda]
MGALDEGRFTGEFENEMKLGFGCGFCGLLEVEVEDSETSVIEGAVKVLLQGLGEDFNRDGLKKTPLRVAKALIDGTRGYRQQVNDIVQGALFPEAGVGSGIGHAGGVGGLVVVRGIDLFSYCESCLLPFKVQCHVGYIPSKQQVVGLSKLSRVADVFAKRLQNPQRLADEVCSALYESIRPSGVAVALQCWHIQFPSDLETSDSNHIAQDMDGWASTSVFSGLGLFKDKACDVWSDFLALVKFKGAIALDRKRASSWCPSQAVVMPECNGHGLTSLPNPITESNLRILAKLGATHSTMIAAVTLILRALGEDPLRKELVNTPRHFVKWLMKFKRSTLEMKGNGFHYGSEVPNPNCIIKESGESERVRMRSELNLPFWSQCEHHLLPFHGVVHVSYYMVEEAEALDRSSLQTIVHFHACKLQVQERLTKQIAESVNTVSGGGGVMVVVEASHICMISRGIEKIGSSTATIAVLGQFASNPLAKAMFLQMISIRTS